MVFDIYTFVEALWLLIPAYAANGLAVVPMGRRALDGGRCFRGKRVLGDGKTWEGTIFALFVAVIVAAIQMIAYPFLPWSISPVPLTIVPMTLMLGFFLGLGAMVGDSAGSFLKRRLGMNRGTSFPLLDQEGFLVVAFLFASVLVPVQVSWIILFVILTPLFHLVANVIGYKIGFKNAWW